MKITIHKGNHSPNILQRFLQLGVYCNKSAMERIVEFDITAKYDLPGAGDDADVNKIFGFGFIKGGHHNDSARFGWIWNNGTGKVDLFAYCYVNGKRLMIKICEAATYFKYLLSIDKKETTYSFSVHDAKNDYKKFGSVDIAFTHKKKWSYRLGCFFGGNQPAPDDITIKISRK